MHLSLETRIFPRSIYKYRVPSPEIWRLLTHGATPTATTLSPNFSLLPHSRPIFHCYHTLAQFFTASTRSHPIFHCSHTLAQFFNASTLSPNFSLLLHTRLIFIATTLASALSSNLYRWYTRSFFTTKYSPHSHKVVSRFHTLAQFLLLLHSRDSRPVLNRFFVRTDKNCTILAPCWVYC